MLHHLPMVSICIPVYNGEKYLEACLMSAISQTYNNVEIIIVDDGSADQSLSLAREILSAYPRKKIYQNEKNLGLVANWSKCIELAGGDWIKFIFQDDIMHDDCIDKMIQQAIRYGSEFILCKREFIFEKGVDDSLIRYYQNKLIKPERIFPDKSILSAKDFKSTIGHLLHENFIGEPVCWLFHKKLFEVVGGFNMKLKIYADYEFALKIILNHPFIFLNETLIQFRVHTSATSQREGKKTSKSKTIDTQIYAQYGDILLLLNTYFENDDLYIFKETWEIKDLKTYYLYIYFKACNLFGEERVQAVLKNIIISSPFADALHYTRMKYFYYKIKYKIKILPRINKVINASID